MVGADAEHATQATIRARPAWLLGPVPGLAAALREEDRGTLPIQGLLYREHVLQDRQDSRWVCGEGDKNGRSRQVRRGPGPPPRLDGRHPRPHGEGRRLVWFD